MQLKIAKIALVTAVDMTNVVFADYRCRKEQACIECSGPIASCNSYINVSLTR